MWGVPDAVCVGDVNRPFQKITFIFPGRTGHLAVSVEGEVSRVDRVGEPGIPSNWIPGSRACGLDMKVLLSLSKFSKLPCGRIV